MHSSIQTPSIVTPTRENINPNGVLPSWFRTEMSVCVHSHTCYVPYPSHLWILSPPNNTWWRAQIMNLHPSVTYALSGPNPPLSTLFSDTLSLCFYLNVRDQVSHPYKQQAKVQSVYFVVYIFDSRRNDKIICNEGIKEIGFGGNVVVWIRLLQDRNQWRSLVNTAKLRVAWNDENFFTGRATFSFMELLKSRKKSVFVCLFCLFV
jgi:hypothetical protein